jgi:hypothetical protein
MTHTLSELVAFLSLGISLSATAAIPFVGWVNADYLLVADWQPVRDRLLVEVVRARHTAVEARRAAAVTAAGLLLLLSAPTAEVNR